jgi:hypothetical protein
MEEELIRRLLPLYGDEGNARRAAWRLMGQNSLRPRDMEMFPQIRKALQGMRIDGTSLPNYALLNKHYDHLQNTQFMEKLYQYWPTHSKVTGLHTQANPLGQGVNIGANVGGFVHPNSPYTAVLNKSFPDLLPHELAHTIQNTNRNVPGKSHTGFADSMNGPMVRYINNTTAHEFSPNALDNYDEIHANIVARDARTRPGAGYQSDPMLNTLFPSYGDYQRYLKTITR